MNKLISTTKSKVGLLSACSPPRSPRYGRISGDADCRRQGKTRKGYVPVIVRGERFAIPAEMLAHPSIAALLEISAGELGYRQEGVLQILCEPESFREMIKKLTTSSVKKSRLGFF